MKALITGITGFVGSHLAEYLLNKDIEVYGIKRWRSPLDNIQHILNRINLYDSDLLDEKSINTVMAEVRPDIVYHLAAQSYVVYSFLSPRITLETNIVGTLNLFEAIRNVDISPTIISCTSSEVYGQVNESEIPITEANPFRPQSPYAVSKVGEDVLSYQYWSSYKMNIIRIRLFTHTGPRRGEVFAESTFAKQIAEVEKGLRPPTIYVGNLDSIRTLLDVRDAVEAYWLAVEKCIPGEAYNIGGVETMSVGDILKKLLSFSTVKDIEIIVDPKRLRPSDVTLQIPSFEKFRKQTGWKPKIPIDKTLRDLLNYWRERCGCK